MSWNIGDKKNLFLKLKSNLLLHLVVFTISKISPEKSTLTVVEIQELPDIGKSDKREASSCLKWTICNGRRKVSVKLPD